MTLRTFIKHVPCTRSISSFSLPKQPPPPPPTPPPQDPHSLLKHDPIQILSDLWSRSFSLKTPFSNLTGFLSNLSLWVLAYQRAAAHFTGTLPSSHNLSSSLLLSLLSLRNAVVSSRFTFNNPKTVQPYLPNPNRKPDKKDEVFQDRVVQEMLLMILEPVFEPRFSSKSHAFRPERNAHTAIRTIRSNFAGYLWFIKADLTDVFHDVDVDLVTGCVRKGVKDKKVLNLIKMAVNEPMEIEKEKVMEGFERNKKKKKRKKKKTILSENEPKPDPYWLRIFYSFSPEEASKVPNYGCCGILSPLLANICLSELDYLMEEKIVEFFKPCKLDSIWRSSINDGSHNPSWPEFVPSSGKERTRKMDYIRYGGHFLIGIRGPREEAVRIRQELIEFCEIKYGIKLGYSKMQIEHISRGIQFLDHKISLRVIHPTLRYTGPGGEIMSKKGIGTLLSVTASLEQCIRKLRQIELLKGDKDPKPMPCNPMIYSGQAHTNVQMNKFLETMADWYRYADNRKKVVAFFAYVIRSSVAKLYAARYRLKSRAKVYKIATRNLSRPLRMTNSFRSVSERSDLLRMGMVEAIEGVRFSQMSMIPSCDYTPFPRNWAPNYERLLREYLRLQDPKHFCELHKRVKQEGLSVPQEEITEILWSCKTLGVRSLLFDHGK